LYRFLNQWLLAFVSQIDETVSEREGYAIMRPSKTRLNQHEKEIVEAFDRDELVLHDPTLALLARFAEAAENTVRKDRRINIRLSDHDLAGIQRKAAEQGIPYQSLISGLIHQFVEGQLATRMDR
jgi:predicted DNA binding CopG/RHH family protein